MILTKEQKHKVQTLIEQMTLEEKIGQMNQPAPSIVGGFEVPFEELIEMMTDGRISQEEFSKIITEAAVSGKMPLNFVIGSSFGLSERVKAACGLRLSMSKMTFAHRLASVMLHEQIYRAVNMINGGKYNHE